MFSNAERRPNWQTAAMSDGCCTTSGLTPVCGVIQYVQCTAQSTVMVAFISVACPGCRMSAQHTVAVYVAAKWLWLARGEGVCLQKQGSWTPSVHTVQAWCLIIMRRSEGQHGVCWWTVNLPQAQGFSQGRCIPELNKLVATLQFNDYFKYASQQAKLTCCIISS